MSDLQEIRNGQTAAELGKMPAWNAGLPETAGEFAKLSRPLSASKPGKLAYALHYKASPGP